MKDVFIMSKILRYRNVFKVYYRNENILKDCNAKITNMYLQKYDDDYGYYDTRLWIYNNQFLIEEHENPFYMCNCNGDGCLILRELTKNEINLISMKYSGYVRVSDLKRDLIIKGYYYSGFNNDFESLLDDSLYYRGENYAYEYISMDDYNDIFSFFVKKIVLEREEIIMKTVKKSKTTRAIFKEYKHFKDTVIYLFNVKFIYFYDMNYRKCYDYNSWLRQNKPLIYFKIDHSYIKKIEVKLDDNCFYETVAIDNAGNIYHINLE